MERHLFTVIVLLPDWLADTYGQDIHITQVDVHEDDAALAANVGRHQVAANYIASPDELPDFFVLAVIEGHVGSVYSDHAENV